jgi:ribosome maturation factor RimP
LVKEALSQELNFLISGYLESQNLELVDLLFRPQGTRLIITVLVDKPPGNACLPARQGLPSTGQSHKRQGAITLQECALLCRQLKNLVEEKNIIQEDYVLEVSSPGLDRPLKKKEDFLRALNKEAVFFLNDLMNGKCQWQGIIYKVDDVIIGVQVDGQILEIPLTKINKAQLVI